MKRLLILVAVGVVAAAMYVAASPAGRQSTGPTARQFRALRKQVATLSHNLKSVKAEAAAAFNYIGACFLIPTSSTTATIAALPVTQFGGTSDGFLFGTSTAAATPRTALDIDTTNPEVYLQEVTPKCIGGNSALRHGASRSGSGRLQVWADLGR